MSSVPTSECVLVPSKRDFLFLATAAMAAVGSASAMWPLIDQMNPDAKARAGDWVDVDLSSLEPGEQILVKWRSAPVAIVRRSQEQIERLASPELLVRLRLSYPNSQPRPSYVADWSRSLDPQFLVVSPICTHLGCMLVFQPGERADSGFGAWPGGWLCPCHGAKFDLAGRVFDGGPANDDLAIPPHRWLNPRKIRIGQNATGAYNL